MKMAALQGHPWAMSSSKMFVLPRGFLLRQTQLNFDSYECIHIIRNTNQHTLNTTTDTPPGYGSIPSKVNGNLVRSGTFRNKTN